MFEDIVKTQAEWRLAVLLGLLTACLAGGCTLRGPLELPPGSSAALRDARSVFVKAEPPGLSDILARQIVQRLNRCNVDARFSGGSATADVLVSYEQEDTGICLDDCHVPPPRYARATIRIGKGEELQWSATRSPLCTSHDCLMELFSKRLAQNWCGAQRGGA